MKMTKLLFIFLFSLQVLQYSAAPDKRLFAAGSSQKLNLLDKVGTEDERLVGVKQTTFVVGTRGTTANKSPRTGETGSGGGGAATIPIYTAGGGANNHHKSVRHSSSQRLVRDGGAIVIIAALLVPFCIF